MSFGGLFDSGSGRGGGGDRMGLADKAPRSSTAMSTNSISQPLLASPSLFVFNSPGLSLTLQSDMEGKGTIGKGGAWDLDLGCQNKEDENESRSGGSDNLGGIYKDDLEQENPRKKKRYHRHTPHQIAELETFFKDCPHPDEKEAKMKTQIERHKNIILRQENDKLRAENLSIREATRNPVCNNCGGLAILGEGSLEEHHLRIENARLKDELDRVCSLIGKFLGKPISASSSPLPLPMSNSTLDLVVWSNVFTGLDLVTPATLPPVTDFTTGATSGAFGTITTPARNVGMGTLDGVDRSQERFMCLELALTAMDELEDPLRVPTLDGGTEILNYEEYLRSFPRYIGAKPVVLVSEATRATDAVIINSLALVETLMRATRWVDMFPFVIARTTTNDVISSGMGGCRNGVLQLMHAELQVLSPLVPVRDVHFLRCNQVTWVEHAEYDEAAVHPLFRPLLSHDDTTTITPSGRRSMLKLAQRMTDNFCSGVCASSAHEWNKLSGGINIGENVRVKTSQNVAEPGEPPGVVLSAATSVWLPIAPRVLQTVD
ncbi:hypothetical protein OPV22_032552 [Ensete ventricosum]|uniref:START domain-containing protein n=1 Tax=Ensete ventricosum TaxID=4639 RepID=A0AAV8P070_ENSVE|nr:hypothetical protein OPV22_032552 [Ensete ventricosum]